MFRQCCQGRYSVISSWPFCQFFRQVFTICCTTRCISFVLSCGDYEFPREISGIALVFGRGLCGHRLAVPYGNGLCDQPGCYLLPTSCRVTGGSIRCCHFDFDCGSPQRLDARFHSQCDGTRQSPSSHVVENPNLRVRYLPTDSANCSRSRSIIWTFANHAVGHATCRSSDLARCMLVVAEEHKHSDHGHVIRVATDKVPSGNCERTCAQYPIERDHGPVTKPDSHAGCFRTLSALSPTLTQSRFATACC